MYITKDGIITSQYVENKMFIPSYKRFLEDPELSAHHNAMMKMLTSTGIFTKGFGYTMMNIIEPEVFIGEIVKKDGSREYIRRKMFSIDFYTKTCWADGIGEAKLTIHEPNNLLKKE